MLYGSIFVYQNELKISKKRKIIEKWEKSSFSINVLGIYIFPNLRAPSSWRPQKNRVPILPTYSLGIFSINSLPTLCKLGIKNFYLLFFQFWAKLYNFSVCHTKRMTCWRVELEFWISVWFCRNFSANLSICKTR